jgi:hypothetical protein
MRLVRLDYEPSGPTFDELYSQWAVQLSKYGDTIEQFATPYILHAKSICSDKDVNYGIYTLEENGEFYAFMHINWAEIPGVKNWTLRINWIQTCPRYEYEDLEPDFVAKAVSTIVLSANNLAISFKHKCSLIKLRVMNSYDRSYWTAYAASMDVSKVLPEAKKYKMGGMWLHIEY